MKYYTVLFALLINATSCKSYVPTGIITLDTWEYGFAVCNAIEDPPSINEDLAVINRLGYTIYIDKNHVMDREIKKLDALARTSCNLD